MIIHPIRPIEIKGQQARKSNNNGFLEEWTSLIDVKEFVDALCESAGVVSDGRLSAAFDGEASFIFADGIRLRGRYHAALCFGGFYYSVTFRSLKKAAAHNELTELQEAPSKKMR